MDVNGKQALTVLVAENVFHLTLSLWSFFRYHAPPNCSRSGDRTDGTVVGRFFVSRFWYTGKGEISIALLSIWPNFKNGIVQMQISSIPKRETFVSSGGFCTFARQYKAHGNKWRGVGPFFCPPRRPQEGNSFGGGGMVIPKRENLLHVLEARIQNCMFFT